MSADTTSPYPGPVDTFIKTNPQATGPFTYEEAVAAATGETPKITKATFVEPPAPKVEPPATSLKASVGPWKVEAAPKVEVASEEVAAAVDSKPAKKASRRKPVDS